MVGRHRPAHPDGAPVPLHRGDRRRPRRRCRSSAIPTTSSTSARRSAACAWAATSATRRPGRSTASRPTSTASCWRPTWPRFEPIMEGAIRRVPAMADAARQPGHQRARGLHAGQRVHPRRVRRPRVLGRGRVLGARHRRRGRDRPAGGELDRRGRARARPLEDGHPPVRGGVSVAGVHAGSLDRELRDLLRHPLPERGARRPAGRCARRRRTRRSPPSARSFGEKSGWERPNWFEPNADDPRSAAARRSRRSDRAAGPASIGRRPSPPRRWRRGEAAALFDETSFAKLEVVGPGACAFLQGVAGNDIDRPVGSIVYTQLLDRRGGIQADLTVTRLADGPVPARDRARPSATTTPPGCARTCPTTARPSRSATSPRPGSASGCGARGRRDILAAVTRDDVSDAGFPYLTAREITRRVRAGPGAAGDLRRRARLGALRPDRVRPRALGDALGGRAGRMAWWPVATGRSMRSASRRAIGSGRATSPRTRRRSRPGSGFAVALDKAEPTPSAATRSWPREGRRAAQAPALPRARRPARRRASATSRSGSMARSSAG